MTPETQRALEYFQGPEGFEMLATGFLPDVGGDPEEYGIDDPTTASEEQLAAALGVFMARAAAANMLAPELAAAVTTGAVDWATVWPVAAGGLF